MLAAGDERVLELSGKARGDTHRTSRLGGETGFRGGWQLMQTPHTLSRVDRSPRGGWACASAYSVMAAVVE